MTRPQAAVHVPTAAVRRAGARGTRARCVGPPPRPSSARFEEPSAPSRVGGKRAKPIRQRNELFCGRARDVLASEKDHREQHSFYGSTRTEDRTDVVLIHEIAIRYLEASLGVDARPGVEDVERAGGRSFVDRVSASRERTRTRTEVAEKRSDHRKRRRGRGRSERQREVLLGPHPIVPLWNAPARAQENQHGRLGGE